MTQRKLSRQFYHAAHEADQDPDFIPDGGLVFRVLQLQDPFAAYLYRGKPTRCFACRQLVEAGETFFTCTGCTSNFHQLCYRCGIAWEIHNGRLTLDQADAIPAYGGPLPADV